jgi:acylphosphatase
MTRVRKGLEVFGIVQGVGFRPYVYRLATQLELNGFITNTASGVSIEIEGPGGRWMILWPACHAKSRPSRGSPAWR